MRARCVAIYLSTGFDSGGHRNALPLSIPGLSPADAIRKREPGQSRTMFGACWPRVTPRRSTNTAASRAIAAVIDARMGGHEDDDVGIGDGFGERRAVADRSSGSEGTCGS